MKMTDSPIFLGYAASLTPPAKKELRYWGLLMASALLISGLFVLLVVFSRIPGSQNIIAWPADFFEKGLVIHVIFAFVIWFLAMFAMLVTLVTYKLVVDREMHLAALGPVGLFLVVAAFPMLFIPAFTSAEASLNNYIPVIIGKTYYFGLGVLALGILSPVIRLFANWKFTWKRLDILTWSMITGSVIYFVALFLILVAAMKLYGQEPSQNLNEDLFWGGGHVLQFLNTTLLLAAWSLLLRLSLGRQALGEGIVVAAVAMLAVFAMFSPMLFITHEAFSYEQTTAFSDAKYIIGIPVFLVGVAALIAFFGRKDRSALPWDNAAFLAVVLVPPVFAAGGTLGFFVDSADTRTPAHYHAMIAGVTLSLMGLFMKFVLPLIDRAPKEGRALRAQMWLFGVGQFIACIGLAWAGWFGAARKTAGDAQGLEFAAKLGIGLNGFGGGIAIIGLAMFTFVAFRQLTRVQSI